MVELATLERVPPHVRDDLVYDFDYLNDPGLAAGLHARLRQLHDVAPPIFYTPCYGGHWVVIGHAANYAVSQNPDLFRSSQTHPGQYDQIPINIDPPQHTAYRLPLMQLMTPRRIQALEGDMRALAASLIDTALAKGRCEFVADFAEPMPVTILMRLVGIPTDRMREFRDWAIRVISTPDQAERLAIKMQVAQVMREVVMERMRAPRDDIMSGLIAARVDDRALSLDELVSYGVILFLAGLDTVTNSLAFAFKQLAEDESLQTRLRADPSLIQESLEEMMRLNSVSSVSRRADRDATFEGVRFKAGDRLMLMLPAANLDPKAFDDPEAFRVDRKGHMAFQTGIHRCVGSHLARREMRIAIEEWLRRVPTFRIDPQRQVRFHPALVMSVDELPLTWA